MSAIVAQGPQLTYVSDEGLALEGDELSVVLLNSGNRPAVIRSVELFVTQPERKDKDEYYNCYEQGEQPNSRPLTTEFATKFDPIVVKPNDVVVAKVQISAGSRQIPIYDGHLRKGRPYNEFYGGYPFLICMTFTMATPSEAALNRRMVASVWKLSYSPLGPDLFPADARGDPFAIIWRKRLRFFN